ncbi:SR-related and CTD-associated factor 4 [Anopheles darlingi]|uniref:SR-related and CTD-associated factor 4 n=1 Tax=Anopheles darlingi TaxID=43151 RepID=UPI00210047DF|nr:SR-related and CTD-associated factor 4 [Anopheles darlingi]
METVRVFNQELSGLYESKPPISKAKMASITRSAMKAIKFYKHVVQSVEKFIQKCKSEYKIPGLYVIDSIVRQSRHQFGPEKDVFAPRFARNMEATFAHLFRCPPEDKSKIIRVLNLWQKNMVFLPEVIQPLFDLANPDHPIHQQYNAQAALQEQAGANGMNSGVLQLGSPPGGGGLLDDHGGQMQMGETKQLDPNTIRQLQQFQQLLMRQTSGDASTAAKDQVKFNKKLLDFDYGSEEEDDKNSPSVMPMSAGGPAIGGGSVGPGVGIGVGGFGGLGLPDLSQMPGGNIAQILSDPNVLKQLQNLQKLKQQEEKQSKLTEMRLKEEKFEKHLASMKLPFANECDLGRPPTIDLSGGHSSAKDVDTDNDVAITGVEILGEPIPISGGSGRGGGGSGAGGLGSSGMGGGSSNDRYKSSSSSSRRKSRSRSPRDRRGGGGTSSGRNRGRSSRSHSRSRSASRSPRSSRRRSSRDRGTSNKDREREKEHERERKRKGLPEIKKEHLSVCSTTLWVGHLSKLVQQEELSDTFGKYGDIVSIDMIPPRGCAFIVMNRRQDAFKCMQSLKNHKMHGRAITISWAAGKGVKSKEWKDYWDLDLGVSYIPWSKLSHATDLESLEDGGMFDEDTLPGWMKDKSAPGGGGAGGAGAAGALGPAGMNLALAGAAGMGLKKLDGSDLQHAAAAAAAGILNPSLFPLSAVDTSQPPPTAMLSMGIPPFAMGAVARLPIPMGIPMGANMVPGLGINVPPPGMMLPGNPPPLPMGGYGVLPPPPPGSSVNAAAMMGNGNAAAAAAVAAAAAASIMNAAAAASNMSKASADDMDIEMDDEAPPNTGVAAPLGPAPGGGGAAAAFFNQPPPPLLPPSAANLPPGPPGGGFFVAGAGGNMSDNNGEGSGDDGGDGRGRDQFGDRDHQLHRGGRRSRDRDQQQQRGGFDRGNDGRGGGDGGRRDRGERGSRWGGGNNFRSGGNNQDDRPLSERLRELAGVLEFNNQRAGGRNFGARGAGLDNEGADFGNADFTRRGGASGNFQQNRYNNNSGSDREGRGSGGGDGGSGGGGGRNQGGRNGQFGNQQQQAVGGGAGGGAGGRGNGGMFGNRAGGRNNNPRGGQFFNDERQQQGGFFDRDEGGGNGYDSGGNNSNSNSNRRNWNNDRAGGNRGNNNSRDDRGRGRQNWRSGDDGPGSGGDGGGGPRFNNRGNNRGGNNNQANRPVRWDDDDENWEEAGASNQQSGDAMIGDAGRQNAFGRDKRHRRQSGNEEEQDDRQDQNDDRARNDGSAGGGGDGGDSMMLEGGDDSSSRHATDQGEEVKGNDLPREIGSRRTDDDGSNDRRYGRDHQHHHRQRNDDPDERPQPILYSPEPEDESESTNLPEDDGNIEHNRLQHYNEDRQEQQLQQQEQQYQQQEEHTGPSTFYEANDQPNSDFTTAPSESYDNADQPPPSDYEHSIGGQEQERDNRSQFPQDDNLEPHSREDDPGCGPALGEQQSDPVPQSGPSEEEPVGTEPAAPE